MSPGAFRLARQRMQLTQYEMASAIGLAGKYRDRTVRRYEAGRMAIPLRTEIAVNLLLKDFERPTRKEGKS